MKPKKIYLIRHGQTDYNVRGIVQGRGVDSDLNEMGKFQAKKFFNAFKEVPFDRIYISALKRTRQSINGFIEMGLPLEVRDGLDEIDWGIKEKEKITSEENAYYHSLISAWSRGETSRRIEGGESPDDVQKRLTPVIEELKRDEGENILVCSHGRTMRILLSTLLNYPLKDMDKFLHQNLSLYLIRFTGSMFSIDLFNDHQHLR